ncbi:hypothetical protein NM688_g2973 [Phlebia brevispora]|uniref:Uncharacterized protein n=1 Tax=Phlebia brevispora TaxID=194682 RepID=A0ACC1T768_9APHY|nr:hypothetical protein NM688_g2973 [Phlebia brevispora]
MNTAGLLTQEVSSTVKHGSLLLPPCLFPGKYNLTFYEAYHLNGTSFFGITPIPLNVENNDQQGICQPDNALEVQPQSFSGPSTPLLASLSAQTVPATSTVESATLTQSPTLPASLTSVIPSTPTLSPSLTVSTATYTDIFTITVGPSGVQWPLTVTPTFGGETIVVESLSVVNVVPPAPTITVDGNGDQGAVTVTISPPSTPSPITIVFVSVATVIGTTAMSGGLSSVFTTMSTSFGTTTGVVGMSGNPEDFTGFLPINAVSSAESLRLTMLVIIPVLLTMARVFQSL